MIIREVINDITFSLMEANGESFKTVPFIPWDSRKNGFTPEMFLTTTVVPDKNSEYGWRVFVQNREKKIRTPKEETSKQQHLYAYVDMFVGNKRMSCRSMSLAALIWLCYLGRAIEPGCCIDHKDEDPLNNSPSNLQMMTVGDNSRKSWKIKKSKKK